MYQMIPRMAMDTAAFRAVDLLRHKTLNNYYNNILLHSEMQQQMIHIHPPDTPIYTGQSLYSPLVVNFYNPVLEKF